MPKRNEFAELAEFETHSWIKALNTTNLFATNLLHCVIN